MPDFLRKLTSCVVQRKHNRKNIKKELIIEKSYFLKLSRFELMSDEILLEIFSYVSLMDLSNSFINLNYRLNYLLRQMKFGIILNENDEKNQFFLNILLYFSKQIQYISIDHYSLINLNLFPNLRSLILYLPTTNQLLSINSYLMPNLCRLSLGIIHKKDQKILYKNLFGENQFSKLKYCNLFQINFNENIYLFENFQNLEKLFLKNCRMKDFLILLYLFPNLNQLEICLFDIYFIENLLNYSHQNLRILKIEFLEKLSQINILNSLFSFVPYVQQCTLFLTNLTQIQDYLYLEKIILNKFLQLKQFICSIDYYCYLSSNQMNNKFQRLKIKFPFFQTIQIIPCLIHQQQCVRKTFMNKTILTT